MTSPRYRTQSEMRDAFRRISFRPSRFRGQNFLVDGNLMRVVAEAGELEPEDVVLEVGAGTGALTALLAERAGGVVAVEVERALYDLAAEQTAGFENVTLLHADALDGAGRISRGVVEAVRDRMIRHGCTSFKLVSNLPYAVATPVIIDLLSGAEPVSLLAFTVQKEVADRMEAQPGVRAYGLLSVIVAATAEIERLREIPRTAFWPRPAVSTALVRLRPSSERKGNIRDFRTFVRVVKGLFSARRKLASNALKLSGICPTREDAEVLLKRCGVRGDVRGDSLSVDEMVALSGELSGD